MEEELRQLYNAKFQVEEELRRLQTAYNDAVSLKNYYYERWQKLLTKETAPDVKASLFKFNRLSPTSMHIFGMIANFGQKTAEQVYFHLRFPELPNATEITLNVCWVQDSPVRDLLPEQFGFVNTTVTIPNVTTFDAYVSWVYNGTLYTNKVTFW
ncbi:MAG: hypothetical protein NWF09_05910 [Candidatus Bathyarchaeota archaeon]|nr:hypothetical protein [Candidatus Bathyarchaeota archaeon]